MLEEELRGQVLVTKTGMVVAVLGITLDEAKPLRCSPIAMETPQGLSFILN